MIAINNSQMIPSWAKGMQPPEEAHRDCVRLSQDVVDMVRRAFPDRPLSEGVELSIRALRLMAVRGDFRGT